MKTDLEASVRMAVKIAVSEAVRIAIDDCCGGRCRHCDRWHDPKIEAACGAGLVASLAKPDDEPLTRWCENCQATCYVDSHGACSVCGWEAS